MALTTRAQARRAHKFVEGPKKLEPFEAETLAFSKRLEIRQRITKQRSLGYNKIILTAHTGSNIYVIFAPKEPTPLWFNDNSFLDSILFLYNFLINNNIRFPYTIYNTSDTPTLPSNPSPEAIALSLLHLENARIRSAPK